MEKRNWAADLQPLIDKYKGQKHPLHYQNIYQLLVMVVLSARVTDDLINDLAPGFFKKWPDMASLAAANVDDLSEYLKGVRSSIKKSEWLVDIAQTIKTDKNIPLTMKELVKLKGIGRKSANVIMREAGVSAEGIIVDLHVVRVAPRLGISSETDADKIEKDIMDQLPKEMWHEIGMAISFLGRDTCRPKNPQHEECVVSHVCQYCRENNPGGCGKA